MGKKFCYEIHFFYFISIILMLSACSKDFDEHYNPERQIDKNIVQILSEDVRFSKFVAAIDQVGLRKTLGEGAIYTCLAPTNEQVDEFLKNNGYSDIHDVPDAVLRRYVNYHFINGMYYKYDFEKKYPDAVNSLSPTSSSYYKTRSEEKFPGKSIRIFTSAFFEAQKDDYQVIYNAEGEGFMAENVKISADQYDIDSSNGVIHVLDSALPVLPRTDEAIARDTETSIFSRWLESQVTYILGPKDEYGRADTTKIKSYLIGRNLADESILTTVFAPTDAAIQEYFEPYMADLYNTIDSVPEKIIYEIIRSTIVPNIWYKSDIVRNNPELKAVSGAYPQVISQVPSYISGSIPASNSVIYKTDQLIVPPKLHSVEGGIYLKHRVYGQWNWMFLHTNLAAGLTDGLYYQHSPRTLLVQSDEVWGSPLAEDMEDEELELRYEECRTGMLNIDVREDGGFRKRYYPTEYGYILYDNKQFIDYTGKSVSLISTGPTWERNNGAIYEIDGFLTPLDKMDATKSVFALISNDPEYSLFKKACIKSGVSTELNLTGFFTYTVFVPTNAAITGAGISVDTMTPAALLEFVNRHIVLNRLIFTDGVFTGNVPDKNGNYMTVGGEWDSFFVTGASGINVSPVTPNKQGCNGVIHKVNQVF